MSAAPFTSCNAATIRSVWTYRCLLPPVPAGEWPVVPTKSCRPLSQDLSLGFLLVSEALGVPNNLLILLAHGVVHWWPGSTVEAGSASPSTSLDHLTHFETELLGPVHEQGVGGTKDVEAVSRSLTTLCPLGVRNYLHKLAGW